MISTTIASLLMLALPQDGGKGNGQAKPDLVPRPEIPGEQTPATETPPTKPAPPPAEAASLERVVLARYLPETSLAVLTVAPVAPNRVAILKSGIEDLTRFVGKAWIKARHLNQFTLSPWSVDLLAERGFSVAITGISDRKLDWVAVAPTPADTAELAEELKESHARQAELGNVVKPVDIGEHKGFTVLVAGGLSISYVNTGAVLLLAPTVGAIERALQRGSAAEPAGSFAATRTCTEFTKACSTANETLPFASVLVQPQPAFLALLGYIESPDDRARVRDVAAVLDLKSITGFGMSFFIDGEELHDFTWLDYPAPRRGLFGALLGGRTTVGGDLLRVSDPRAISTTLLTLDLAHVDESWASLVESLRHAMPEFLRRNLGRFTHGKWKGLRKALQPVVGRRAVLQELPRKGHYRTFGLAVELTGGKGRQAASTIERLAAGLGLRRGVVESIPTFAELEGNAAPTLITVHKDTLILTNSPRFLVDTASRLDTSGVGPKHAFVDRIVHDGLPPGLFGWGNSSQLGREWTQSLGIGLGHRKVAGELGRMIRVRGGSVLETGRATAHSIELRTRSPYGNPQLTLTLAFLLRLAEMNGTDEDSSRMRLASLFRDILAAQYDYQLRGYQDANNNQTGEFAGLRPLVETSLIAAHRFTAMPENEPFEAENYRLRMYLPQSAEDRESEFLGLAWPGPQTSGPVFAITANGSIYRNEILGRTGTLSSCDPRDFFDKGKFGGEILPSWQLLETNAVRTITGDDDPANLELSNDEKAAISALDQARKSGQVPAEVVAYLSSKSALVTAHAAKTMGVLRHKPSIDRLIQLVHDHNSAEVKRQAIIALAKMRDRRSIDISIAALASPDPLVRTQAAQNLGFLHATQAVASLTNVLSMDPRIDAPDRTAALLALADIGDPDCLLPAALRVKQQGELDQKSLTYLFQSTSVKMRPKQEAQTLMAVLDHPSEMLRRYAIQRLGVLALPETSRALMNRLPKEKELRGLVEVSLEKIRKGKTSELVKEYLAKIKVKALEIWNRVPRELSLAVLGALLLMMYLLRRIMRRRRLAKTGARFAAMVAPSDEFVEEHPDGVEYYQDDEYPTYSETQYIEFDQQQVEEYQDDPHGDYFLDRRR